MPNWRIAPTVVATIANRPRRRGILARRGGGIDWWQMIKVAWLLDHFRPRRRSPSVKQTVLRVVGVGLAITAIGAVIRHLKSRSAAADAGTQDEAQERQDEIQDEAQERQDETHETQDEAQERQDETQETRDEAQERQDETQETQDEPQDSGSSEPAPGNDSVASETKLTDRVRSEMFQRSDAPAPATESG